MSNRLLWATAIVSHAADIVSTAAALSIWPAVAYEGGPLAAMSLGAGVAGLALLKVLGFVGAAGVWAAGRRAWPGHEWVVPATLAAVGSAVTAWNVGAMVARATGVIGA
jgi:hypothetical protein